MPIHAPHRPPTHAHRWIVWLLLSQFAVVWVWWRFGWRIGAPFMVMTHVPFWWGVLKPQSAFYGPVLSHLQTNEPVVWLTIDDGPSDDTRAILDLLDAHDAKASFFVVADRAKQRPELLREIVARGHGIGNHSTSHPSATFWALGPTRMRREISEAQATLVEITGAAPRWFRAVVGMANPFVSAPLREHGLTRVAWSARGFDAVAKSPQAVAARIARDLKPGAIVLLHEGAAHGQNVAQLKLVLEELQRRGLRADIP